MSVFERKLSSKVLIDDTDVMVPSIINSEFKDGHTEYVIRVEKGYTSENRWYLNRRYNDFLALHHSLQTGGLLLNFPPKKYIGNLDRKFISERQLALQIYLDEIVSNPILSSSFPVKHFLDPFHYRANSDDPLNELQMAIRSEMDIKSIKLLPQLGWRFRKKSFMVNFKASGNKEYLLQWIPFGPDKHMENEELSSLLKTLTSLQHVNISKIEKSGIHKGGGWVLHDVINNGSLLDVIYGIKEPLNSSALKKYANLNQRKPLETTEIIEIASQVLQALAFIHHKGIPYGHLHLGNIARDGNLVKIYGFENTLFGLPSFYRTLLVHTKTLESLAMVDVYCFGLVLYELLFAKSFCIQTKEIPVSCPDELKCVLESILSVKAGKKGLPTVKDLLNLRVFRRPPPNPQPYLKMTQLTRDCFDIISTKVIARIKEDNCKVRELKKMKTMQKMLTEN